MILKWQTNNLLLFVYVWHQNCFGSVYHIDRPVNNNKRAFHALSTTKIYVKYRKYGSSPFSHTFNCICLCLYLPKKVPKLTFLSLLYYSTSLCGHCNVQNLYFWNYFVHKNMKKQARKGFRPISASQNLFAIFWEFFENFLKIVLGIFLEILSSFLWILWEISGNSLEIYWNSLGILNCTLTPNCECDLKYCKFWLKERQERTG